jgi:cob(I)alamin adenosyltransferase
MVVEGLGMLQVYTGNGKGKTTAALGLSMRAAGHGFRVVFIQFMKGQINYGELESARRIPNLEIRQFGRAEFVDKSRPEQIDIDLAREGFEYARKIIGERACDLLVLDELNVAIEWGLLPVLEVVELLRSRPDNMEIVTTGRHAPREILALADLVTEMNEVRHPYARGVLGREGIEY